MSETIFETGVSIPMAVRNRLGILIAEKRMKEKRNITLEEIAKSVGVVSRTLQAWLNDDVTRYDAKLIEGLCRFFDCKIQDLLEIVPDPESQENPSRS